jgi:hypothetical protein
MKKAFTPEELFPAGEDYTIVTNPFTGLKGKARKATVAATLNNIAFLNRLLLENAELDQIQSIKEAIRKLIPSLKVIGVFDLFNLEEWISDDRQLGRIYVIALYLKQYPEEMTDPLALKLNEIKRGTKSLTLRSELDGITK